MTKNFIFTPRFYVLKKEMKNLQKRKNHLKAQWFGIAHNLASGFATSFDWEQDAKINGEYKTVCEEIDKLRSEIKKEPIRITYKINVG
jgi:hypothetical protein